MNDAEARSRRQSATRVRGAQADTGAVESGGNRGSPDHRSQLVKAHQIAMLRSATWRAAASVEEAASPGGVKDAENQVARADADQMLQQAKDRYSQPEIARWGENERRRKRLATADV